jgi:hypothetical protein
MIPAQESRQDLSTILINMLARIRLGLAIVARMGQDAPDETGTYSL